MSRKSKQWPKEGPVPFRDLATPICDGIRFAYKLSRRNLGRSIPWVGYNIGDRALVRSFPPHEMLRRSQLHYYDTEQGRDALEVLIGIAVQLGIEQGRRMERQDSLGKDALAVILAKEVLRKSDQT